MADIKLQIYRGDAGPEKVDFRESTGEFVGTPGDEHRTVIEMRVPDEGIESQMDEIATANNVLAKLASNVPIEGATNLAGIFGLGGSGPIKLAVRVYDND